MEYIILAFRSRSETVKFYNIIIDRGINCEIVNTPKEAGVGCGISVKLNMRFYQTAKNIIKGNTFKSFAGCFAVKVVSGKKIIKSI